MAMYGRELIVCGGARAGASRKREGAWKQWRRKKRRVMAANATAEVQGQEPAALAAKERIDAMAAPTSVVDAQVAMGKGGEGVVAATATAEGHRDAAAGAAVFSAPPRGCRATVATNGLAATPAAGAAPSFWPCLPLLGNLRLAPLVCTTNLPWWWGGHQCCLHATRQCPMQWPTPPPKLAPRTTTAPWVRIGGPQTLPQSSLIIRSH